MWKKELGSKLEKRIYQKELENRFVHDLLEETAINNYDDVRTYSKVVRALFTFKVSAISVAPTSFNLLIEILWRLKQNKKN